MKKLYIIIRSKFSMKKITNNHFTDVVSGESVHIYEDFRGIEYLASSKFGFRIPRR